MNVPPLPAVDPELLAAHDVAHRTLGSRFDAAGPQVRLLFTHLQRRLTHEGLAYVQSVSPEVETQLLLPPPRASLTHSQQDRIRGAVAAFRHIDTRVTLERNGQTPCALHRTSPTSLHALLEGPNPGRQETNPGMYRASPTFWQFDADPFHPPHHSEVEALVTEALEVVDDRSRHPAVRAGWLTYTMLSIHPFVDGNGRTCRSLYLLVASPALPLVLDWGIMEQWSLSRSTYIEMLRAGNKIPRYDPMRMTAEPFATYSTVASIRGAEVCIQRIDELGRRYEARRALGLSAEAATIAGVIEYQRSCTWDELLTTGLPIESIDDAVAELLDRGAVRWAPRPASRRTILDAATSALVLA